MVTQQPTTFVVVHEPTDDSAAPQELLRDWNDGVFDCLSDYGSCLLGYFCLPCLMCNVSTRLGENCLAAHVALPALRTKLRMANGIQGGICDDWFCSAFLLPCAVCQMDRELKYLGR